MRTAHPSRGYDRLPVLSTISGTLPTGMRQDSTMRSVLVLGLLVGDLSVGCDEEPTELAAAGTKTQTTNATVTETDTETVVQEPSGVCLDPTEIRRRLLAYVLASPTRRTSAS